jgi:hypothetical protein
LRAEITERQYEFRIHREAIDIWKKHFEQPDENKPPRSDLGELKINEIDGKIVTTKEWR